MDEFLIPLDPSQNCPAPNYRRSGAMIPSAQQLQAHAFASVDFETANRTGGVSACQVALVRVEQGRIVDRFTSYIKPPQGYRHFDFSYLHGIGPAQIRQAPAWDELANHITSFVDGLPVYAHNASFDTKVWRELDAFYHTVTLPT